jgi:hypothetical protein
VTLDPYRTLGLEPGASSAEVKRAYRRLAKAFHPDSAGEAALPRFLAIHEAYEAIRLGRQVGASRAGPRPAERSEPPSTAEPWRADPARARAARERARTGRARSGVGGTAGRGGDPRARSAGGAGAAGSTGAPGPAGTTRSTGSSGTSGTRGRRGGTRKATLGSTSYDEARDPSDASWSGAAWYGPTTGEYWIINPREYADPRKHGPDYQSRARRVAADPSVSSTVEDEPPFVAVPVDEVDVEPDHAAGWTAEGPTMHDAGGRRRPSETRAAAADPSRARARAGRAAQASRAARPRHAVPSAAAHAAWDAARIREARRSSGRATAARDGAGEPGGRTALVGEAARDWFAGSGDDQVRRLGSALVAWPPIGLAAAAAIGDVTGCSTYSVACGDVDTLLPWLAQAGILGLLLLLPSLARILMGGTVAVLIALVPVTAFLLVVGGAGAPQAGFALAFFLGIAWVLGIAGSIIAASRRRLPSSDGKPA